MKRLRTGAAARLSVLVAISACALIASAPGALATHGGDREVTVASNDAIFSQNKQNEPAIAVDANHPNILAAGANDNIDMEACNAGDDTTCPFTPDVGGSGIYFSFDSGDTWIQPEYTGLTARGCLGVIGPDPGCEVVQGPIGTLPHYDEAGLVSDGDPALAFGPQPGADGSFSWDNGSRLYYANLTSNVSASLGEPGVKGVEGIAVSRSDDVAAAAAGDESAWMAPVIASKQSSATFADKEQLWADNAASSPFFGNVYICYASFTGNGAAPMIVSRSTNGGDSWSTKQVSPAHNVAPGRWGQSGCTIRTDSDGVVYVFWEQFQSPFRFLPPVGTHFMAKSFDGGVRWTRPRALRQVTDPCYFLDPVLERCVEDGVAGARNDLSAAPSVDIANGAPTGADATDFMITAWADGRDGVNKEHVMISTSPKGGRSWSDPVAIEDAGDRGYYAAPALSPNGTDAYVVYNAFTTPFRDETSSLRGLVGVVKHADVSGATLGAWGTLHRGAEGDPRGSSQNNLVAEFLGDYVYAVATRTYAAAVWNDARDAADCPAIDAWRMSLQTEDTSDDVPTPAPQQDCPATFGNTDIFGWSGLDPTP
jgi:hypothetical protein